MKQSPFVTSVFVVLAFSSMLVTVSAAVCGGCMPSNVACTNETHYKVCINGEPIKNGGILSCGTDRICTDLGEACWKPIDGDDVEPVCNPKNVDCRKCSATSLFVCTSKTTFQMCTGDDLSPQINTCPKGLYCSMDSGKICVKQCLIPDGKFECNKDAP